MKIKGLVNSPAIKKDNKLKKKYENFDKLISELNKKEIPSEIVNLINQDIDEVNSFSGSDID
jgi:hypothetical protein